MGENIGQVRDACIEEIRRSLSGGILSAGMKRPKQNGVPVRTDSDDLAEKPTAVIFGSGELAHEFLLYPKPHLEADEWRVAAMAAINATRPALLAELASGDIGEVTKSAEAVLNLANMVVMGAIPAITELVFTWEPSLDRDLILRDLGATDAQIAAAFVACLQLAFPFHSTLREVGRLIQGSQKTSASPTTDGIGTPQ